MDGMLRSANGKHRRKKGSPQAASLMSNQKVQRPFERSFWIAASCATAAAISAWAFA